MLDQTNLGVMLKNKNLLKDKAYINGNWVDAKSGKTFEVVNPSDGNLIVNVPDLDTDAMLQKSPWHTTTKDIISKSLSLVKSEMKQ